MSISYLSYPVVKNEEESDYYYLLKKDDANCQKDILIKSKISQIYKMKKSKKRIKIGNMMLYPVLEEMIMKKLISLLLMKKIFKVLTSSIII
jgi:hypothetical protein